MKQQLNEIKRMQQLAGLKLNENYDLVSQFKLGNGYLTALGLDENGIKTLQTWVNLMKADKSWYDKTYPNGAEYTDLISNILKKVKDLPSFIQKYESVNPIKVVNFIKK